MMIQSTAYKRYALVLMTTVYGVNLIERGLLSLLLESIRIDLDLSDSQIGAVTGLAFGLFYTFAGVAMSRWADRGDRSLISAISIGLWGVAMMSFMFVSSFIHLMLARMSVAIGEAGCKPPTYSMVGDFFPGAVERTRAMTIYWLSNPLAALVGFIGGGWLNEMYGWRQTFLIMGIPGMALAVLVWLTLEDPRPKVKSASRPPAPSLLSVFLIMWRQPTARNLMIALILFYTLAHGMSPWYAAFMIRSHGMTTSEVGWWLGISMGAAGVLGILIGGYVASRWLARDETRQLQVTGVIVGSLVLMLGAFLLSPNKFVALAMLLVYMSGLFFLFAPTFALFQRLMPENVRATTLAIVMTLVHVISMGFGPQVVGILSDLLMPSFGVHSLRYAMTTVSLVAILAAHRFWIAGRTVTQDLRALGTASA